MKTLSFAPLLMLHARASESYDYVVIGAGTSGLVVANRLSEDASVTVAVIEPGADERDNPLVTDPTKFGQAFGTAIDWQYKVRAQPGTANRELVLRQGKAWGGTSVLNGMTYVRGEADVINAWESLGNTNWTWASLLPYYKKSEDFSAPNAEQLAVGATYQSQHHGFEGPVGVGYTSELKNGSFSVPVIEAWKEIGLEHNPDLNSGSLRGFGMGPQTLDAEENVRCDASRAYYLPVESRSNLKIISGTAKRLIWSSTRKDNSSIAEGVEYATGNGNIEMITADKEVIISAGAIKTPLILESSGIGNPRLLQKLGIKPIIDLPGVGENLVGQTGNQFTYSGNLEPAASAYHSFLNVEDLYGDAVDETKVSTREKILEWAQTATNASGGDASTINAVIKVLTLQHDLLFNKRVAAAEVLTIVVDGLLLSQYWILQPFSRGCVHLNSTGGIDSPLIAPQYLSVDFDISAAINTGEKVRKFWKGTPISRYVNGTLSASNDILPENATYTQWETYLRTSASASTRSMGTAAMMARELGGVVDPELKVYGTVNVRVVDASVLPMQTSGHVTATLYAIAERASDIIKDRNSIKDTVHSKEQNFT